MASAPFVLIFDISSWRWTQTVIVTQAKGKGSNQRRAPGWFKRDRSEISNGPRWNAVANRNPRNEMPELPEVETVRRGLIPAMQGAVIAQADVRRPDLRWPFPENFAARLTGQRVTALRRRSKYILADLASGETLVIHLGMSGRMLISGDPLGQFHHNHPTPEKHDHVILFMDNGSRIVFNDARRFGAMDLGATATIEDHWLLSKLGPEPLGNGFNESYLIDRLRNRNTPIKSALLDQRIVAGLGNIYVCEVLFRARISPKRKAGTLPATRVRSLVPTVREVLTEAIEAGGSSLRDYRQADGELGYFQHSFKVYDREDQPCTTPGCDAVITRIVQSGRSSFYCPQCQR
jgi:formamidopyrimidine-DNA glycosylase